MAYEKMMCGYEKAVNKLQEWEHGQIIAEGGGFLVSAKGKCALWFRDNINYRKYRENQVVMCT